MIPIFIPGSRCWLDGKTGVIVLKAITRSPRGRRPFENFEPILKVLESIDPDNREPFLHRMSEYELKQLASSNPNFEIIKPYTDSVVEIEKVTWVWMENLINQAALKVTDEKIKAWLEAASLIGLPKSTAIFKLQTPSAK